MRSVGPSMLVVAIAAAPACELLVPDYSPVGVDPAVDGSISSDATDAPPAECILSTDCTAPEVCVMGECRACDDDAHCGDPMANVCLPDGTCAALSRLAYASPTGAGAACTLASPCAFEQAFALAAGSPSIDIVKLIPGTYARTTAFTFTGDTAILAGQGATLMASNAVQMLRIESGNLTIVGAELVGDQQFNTLCIPQTGVAATLSLYRVVSRAGAYGVGGFSCALAVSRSTITGASNIGMYAQQGSARISSSVFTGNGNAGAASGGVMFVNCPDAQVALSTFVGNTSGAADHGASLECSGSPATITSSILWGNTGPETIDPNCTIDYSIVDPSYGAGAHNVRSDPMFVAAGDYHIGAASPARGLADPAVTSPAIDREGQPRPQGGTAFDSGADEVP